MLLRSEFSPCERSERLLELLELLEFVRLLRWRFQATFDRLVESAKQVSHSARVINQLIRHIRGEALRQLRLQHMMFQLLRRRS